MTARELKKKLIAAGWKIIEGKNHSLATHSEKIGTQIAIPRHKGDIPVGTLRKILRDAGLE